MIAPSAEYDLPEKYHAVAPPVLNCDVLWEEIENLR